jgi:hypothetical protein
VAIDRFVVQRRPLLEIMRESDQHWSDRPEGLATILAHRELAPEHDRYDPTAAILRRCAAGTSDPKASPPARDAERAKAVVADLPDARAKRSRRPAHLSQPDPRLILRDDPLPYLLAVDADIGRRGEPEADHVAFDGDHRD